MNPTTRNKLSDAVDLMERAKCLLEEARDEVSMSWQIDTLAQSIADVDEIQGDLEEFAS